MTTSNDDASNNPPSTVLSTRTVKVQIKNNPRSMYYTGSPSREHTLAKMRLFAAPDAMKFDRARVHGFIKSLKTGDIVGVEHYQYRVGKASLRNLTVSVTTARGEEKELDKDHLNIQLALGFAEILYRDDKPYGIETEKEVTVKIVGKKRQEEESSP